MIAWKLTLDFNDQRHLFTNTITTNYLLDTYICSCGHVESIIKCPLQDIEYICTECENDFFHDANRALEHPENFILEYVDLKLETEYRTYQDIQRIVSSYGIKIPTRVDFLSKKVIYSYTDIYTTTLVSDGYIEEVFPVIDTSTILIVPEYKHPSYNEQIICEMLKENLIKHINNSCFDIPKSVEKRTTIQIASFLLSNKYLKEFDFYYWDDYHELPVEDLDVDKALLFIANNRKVKSIKKALYQNYIEQLLNNKKFQSSLISSFISNIEDINIVVTFLNYKYIHSTEVGILKSDFDLLIQFLKQIYTEKQILNLFLKYDYYTQEYLLRDMITELTSNYDLVRNIFNKVPCTVETLHDEFVRCVKEERYSYIYNKKLDYKDQDISPCSVINTYSVRLPQTGQELYDWADTLHNCMSSYFDMIDGKRTIIYGFFQNNNLSFAIEVQDKKIIQHSGKYNKKLTEKEESVLRKWFKIYFVNVELGIESVA